jgi:hypothetical protein
VGGARGVGCVGGVLPHFMNISYTPMPPIPWSNENSEHKFSSVAVVTVVTHSGYWCFEYVV